MTFSHRFDPTTLREYDIRGTVGGTLSEADAFAIGRCFGSLVVRGGGRTVAVGYDGRLSSPSLEAALANGLSASGIEAIRIGRGPTPMLYYANAKLATDGAVMVTGSHNPPDYNGFKMVLGGKPFYGEQIRALGGQAAAGDVVEETVAPERNVDVAADYVARVLADWDGGDRLLKVVWDNGNGAAGEVLAKLVAGLPGEHIVLNGTIDGTFPAHHPDPTVPKNLEQLIAEVAARRADIGIALDGDADRIGLIDDKGRILFGDQLLVILARDVLREHPGATIIADVKASQVLFDEVARAGGDPLILAAAVQHVRGAAQVLLIGDGSRIGITDTGMDRAVLARRFLVRFVAEVVGNHQCRHPAFRFRHAHRAVDQVTDLRSGASLLHEGAGHVLEHADQVDFLLIMPTERRAGLLAGDRQHRDVIHPGVIHPGDQVRRARARSGDANAELACELRIGRGHERSHFLVARLNELNLVSTEASQST